MKEAITFLAVMAIAVCLRGEEAEEAKVALGKDWEIPADKEKFHIFLPMGQSNMAGGIKEHQPGHLLPEDQIPVPHIVQVKTNIGNVDNLNWFPAARPLHYRPGRPNSFGLGSSSAMSPRHWPVSRARGACFCALSPRPTARTSRSAGSTPCPCSTASRPPMEISSFL